MFIYNPSSNKKRRAVFSLSLVFSFLFCLVQKAAVCVRARVCVGVCVCVGERVYAKRLMLYTVEATTTELHCVVLMVHTRHHPATSN